MGESEITRTPDGWEIIRMPFDASKHLPVRLTPGQVAQYVAARYGGSNWAVFPSGAYAGYEDQAPDG